MQRIVKSIISTVFAVAAGIGCWYFITHTTWFEDQFGFIAGSVHVLVSSSIVALLTFWLFQNVCMAGTPAQADSSTTTQPHPQEQTVSKDRSSQPKEKTSEPVRTGQSKRATETSTEAKSQETNPPVAEPIRSSITFADIAGYEQIKRSMQFLVVCLKDPQRLDEIGAKIPTGIMLYGPPGTGKTLFGHAIAGEAQVPFFYVAASSFVEKFVGVGAQRVRELFALAKKNQPCVLFLDEIDAIGNNRSDGSNEERQQTLNQLLVEISNLSMGKNQVLLMAATNRLEMLDAALLRPGRFDRKIAVPLPTSEDRLAILQLTCRKKKVNHEVNLKRLAMMTEGMAGADLTALLNEAAIQAVYHQHDDITQEDVDIALFHALTGGEKLEVTDKEDQRVIAYHEAGHALATKLLTEKEVSQVSIIGSTSGPIGLTMQYSSKDVNLISKRDLETELKVLYAGRAAEECYFGNSEDITTGASNDLKQASRLIREYLTTYGMGKDSVLNMAEFSRQPDGRLMEEAKELAHRIYQETVVFLQENRSTLDRIVEALLEEKVLDTEKLNKVIQQKGE